MVYSKSRTPQLYDVTPNQVYRGQMIQFQLNPWGADDNNFGDGSLVFKELSLGGT